MNNALIGYTGFVGGNLNKQTAFSDLYNSRNIHEIKGKHFDEIVCAGVSAVKWMANKDPVADREKIKVLEDLLATITSKRFILISTIDVYPVTQGKDEFFNCRTIENHAYGTHRLDFEDFCKSHFPNCYIVRLPGLFGDGLKKNVIFDLLNDNCLEMINPKSSFQYYYLNNLWSDIQVATEANIKLINLFTEPVSSESIIQRFFPDKALGQESSPEIHYDLYTHHASLWGKTGKYVYSRNEILDQLDEFITHFKNP